MRNFIIGTFALVAVAVGTLFLGVDKHVRYLLTHPPTDTDVLFWSTPQRDGAFRTMDWFSFMAESNVIAAGDKVLPLPEGEPLAIDLNVDQYMADQRTAAMVILHDGKIRLEKYGLDFTADGRWTSFSVAKSFTSTLVGAAIKDGYIKNIDDKVTDYIPDLRGSAYDDVSIKQLLTMTSGVRWNEDYADENSDVARFNNHQADPGIDTTVSYMRNLPRDVPAGSKWVYNTGETNLIGVLVGSATGKSLSGYLSETLWAPLGMQQDGSWLLGSTGSEISGCCVQAATRDFARFGLFMLDEARIDGESVLPQGWIASATTRQADTGYPDLNYGYQWWTYDDGSYAARGIFGQGIFLDPLRNLVIASNSNWLKATDRETVGKQREAFYAAVQAAIDAEQGQRE
jgi:CubicO group peptidase (beta-lactamase class C family)